MIGPEKSRKSLNQSDAKLKPIIRFDERLTLETSALKLFTEASLRYQLIRQNQITPLTLSPLRVTSI